MSKSNRMIQLSLLLIVPHLTHPKQDVIDGNRGVRRSSYQNSASYANFAVHKYQRLQGSLLDASLEVDKASECTLACLNNQRCFSFNLALMPNEKKKLQCELLTEDKYGRHDKLVVSQKFDHYSIKVKTIFSINIGLVIDKKGKDREPT